MHWLAENRVLAIEADARRAIELLESNSIDSIVTDPPYGIKFMSRRWDDPNGAAFDPGFWNECCRVLKPGAYVAAFGGARTYHRLACAIEEGGFEVRDTIMWLYGTGFPKSEDSLKPAVEPIVLARKPIDAKSIADNILFWRTGALNIDRCRIETAETISASRNVSLGSASGRIYGAAATPGLYVQHPQGRWPANVVHDGSAEVVDLFPFSRSTGGQASLGAFRHGKVYGKGRDVREKRDPGFGDSGSAARFFYCAKASKEDRAESRHPTVKPISLLRWLVRLVTPSGGTVLDPFAGSGTTGAGAVAEGMHALLIEREPEYIADIRRRFGEYDFG